MDKKKLIGTIVGVIAFIALIAGATFAWFTYNITLNKAGYNFTSANFSIVYGHGADITGVKMFATEPTTSDIGTGAANGNVDITAKTTGSVTGTFKIYLNINSGSNANIISKGALKYAICEGSTTIAATSHKGTVSGTSPILLMTYNNLDTTQKTFHVYLYLDATKVDQTLDGAQFSGYISASAEQTH